MSHHVRVGLAAAAVGMALAAVPVTAAAKPATKARAGRSPSVTSQDSTFRTFSYPIQFTVVDKDTTSLAKTNPGDGRTYTVNGHISGPVGALDAGSPATTVYMPGLGYGEWLWRFTAVPGYNYADAEASRGLTSVTVDKLGYGSSGIPDGRQAGYGTEASIDHQIIQDLKDGNYTVAGHKAVDFAKVGLGAHSQSVLAAELEQATYHDANALVFTNWDDAAVSPSLLTNYSINVANCTTTPLNQGGPGTPSGYQYRERTAAMFIQDNLAGAQAPVTAAAAQLHSKDPCGYPEVSVLPTFGEANLLTPVSLGRTPVISVIGSNDPELEDVAAVAHQRVEFAADPNASVQLLGGGDQAITLGPQFRTYQALNADFLCSNGFGYDNCQATSAGSARR